MENVLKKFIKFALVGSIGACIQVVITYLLTKEAHFYYMLSVVIAIGLATIWNFSINYKWTFREKK